MPTFSGLTTFGIVRRRMSDLYLTFARRIKEGGAFGLVTTVDTPDLYPGDPLVQIAATASASTSEVWEVAEFFYAQLDPASASGLYLERLHGARIGITKAPGQSDDDYRAVIAAALQSRPLRNDIVTLAVAQPDIECAALHLSTVANPIAGIEAPGAMLVVKGCAIDYAALAEQLFQHVELGLHTWHGDVSIGHASANGGCIQYKFQPAQPVYVAMRVKGYLTDACGKGDLSKLPKVINDVLVAVYGSCGLNATASASALRVALANLSGFVVTDLKLATRRKQLWGDGCDTAAATIVTLCGQATPWATSTTCGPSAGEVWCDPNADCIELKPWEYIAFDQQFITVIEDSTLGGCA
jgi:hypothetical protein